MHSIAKEEKIIVAILISITFHWVVFMISFSTLYFNFPLTGILCHASISEPHVISLFRLMSHPMDIKMGFTRQQSMGFPEFHLYIFLPPSCGSTLLFLDSQGQLHQPKS